MGILWMGLVLPDPAVAKHKKDHDETSGICPQPRKTVKAPEKFLKLKNPVEVTPQNILAGKTLFHVDAKPTACKVCHGISGDGLGILFHRVEPKPRNFTCVHTMDDLPDGQLFWVIKNGSPGTAMPSFSYLADEQVWQLILYLRSFSKKE
jgi:mono/diheme cytochrome c family protein